MSAGSKLGVSHQFFNHLVLEDNAPNGDAECLAEGAKEAEHRDREGEVLVVAGGLELKLEGREEDA